MIDVIEKTTLILVNIVFIGIGSIIAYGITKDLIKKHKLKKR